jgi:hypothetical protein
MPSHRNTVADFWARVQKSDDPDGCWLFMTYARDTGEWRGPNVYGQFRFNGRPGRAHVLSYEWFNSPVPPGLFVLHDCHRPACVRPSHLHLGTHLENIEEMKAAGRAAWQNPDAPWGGRRSVPPDLWLRAIDAQVIRFLHAERHVTYADLSRWFSSNPATISDIVTRKVWQGLPDLSPPTPTLEKPI